MVFLCIELHENKISNQPPAHCPQLSFLFLSAAQGFPWGNRHPDFTGAAAKFGESAQSYPA